MGILKGTVAVRGRAAKKRSSTSTSTGDARFGFELHNGAAAQTFGLGLDEAAGVRPGDALPPDRHKRTPALTIQDGTVAVGPCSRRRRRGDTRRWVAGEGRPALWEPEPRRPGHGLRLGERLDQHEADGASAIDWTNAIDLQAGEHGPSAADPVTVLGTTIDLTTGGGTSVSGSLSNVNIAGVLTGSAGFGVTVEDGVRERRRRCRARPPRSPRCCWRSPCRASTCGSARRTCTRP